jgi:hypothetical protein
MNTLKVWLFLTIIAPIFSPAGFTLHMRAFADVSLDVLFETVDPPGEPKLAI